MFRRKSSGFSDKIADKRRTSLKDAFDLDTYEITEETKYEIKTEKCGKLQVYVQGTIQSISLTTPVFLTVHDIGTNHREFHKLVEHPCMAKLKARSVWIHVEIPGQEFDAADLPDNYTFPSIQDFAEDIVLVLNFFNIKYCVAMGEGAGANIVTRFAIAHPDRALGCVLMHCTCSVAGVMQYFNDKIVSWKLSTLGMNSTAEQYLVLHKFGTIDEKDRFVQKFVKRLHTKMNAKNLRLYVESYLNRTDLTTELKKLKLDTMLVTGSRSSHVASVEECQVNMDPKITTTIRIDDCSDIFTETPDTFAYNLLLFCQGLGLFSALPMSRHGSICA
ncbi:Uncharacterized protein HDE_02292 [Halotydeus destructor]|nr:Uncharacterized protein HDE_02292 [Halotydeus destructor]